MIATDWTSGERHPVLSQRRRLACGRWLVRLLWLAVILVGDSQARGQDCATAVTRASRSYDLGNFGEVIGVLTPCIPNLAPIEREQAYRFLALAHLFRDEYQAADSAIDAMLTLDPTYPRDPARDPYELLRAMSAYDWYPQLVVEARLCANRASPNVVRAYTLEPIPTSLADRRTQYSGAIGHAYALGFSYHFTKALALGVEGGVQALSFSREGETGDKFQATYQEDIVHYVFPVFARYEFPFLLAHHPGGITPYIECGAYGEWLSSATSSISASDAVNAQTPSSPQVFSTTRRKPSSFGTLLGIGATVQSGGFQLGASLRYYDGLTDIVDGTQRYSQSELWYQYYYLDDDFTLRNLEFSLTASYPLKFGSYKSEETE